MQLENIISTLFSHFRVQSYIQNQSVLWKVDILGPSYGVVPVLKSEKKKVIEVTKCYRLLITMMIIVKWVKLKTFVCLPGHLSLNRRTKTLGRMTLLCQTGSSRNVWLGPSVFPLHFLQLARSSWMVTFSVPPCRLAHVSIHMIYSFDYLKFSLIYESSKSTAILSMYDVRKCASFRIVYFSSGTFNVNGIRSINTIIGLCCIIFLCQLIQWYIITMRVHIDLNYTKSGVSQRGILFV